MDPQPASPSCDAGSLARAFAAHEVEALWREYEAQATPEAHMVKDFDKLEMIIQVSRMGGPSVAFFSIQPSL